jgi:hypothetical protein
MFRLISLSPIPTPRPNHHLRLKLFRKEEKSGLGMIAPKSGTILLLWRTSESSRIGYFTSLDILTTSSVSADGV